jgi:Protein of unknown function (DUF3892)
MLSVRIYDVEFASNTNRNHPSHISKYWWRAGNQTGIWTREQAHDYVVAHRDTVYVSEGQHAVKVIPYHHPQNPTSQWIQTRPDDTTEDNLVTLAKRHAAGLVNV